MKQKSPDMTSKKRVWIFSLGDLSSCAPQIRFLGPFGYFPENEFEFIYAPSLAAVLKLACLPDVIVFHRNAYPLREIDRIIDFARKHGIPTVMDIDDLITEVPVQHPSHLYYQGVKNELVALLRKVDFITLTNHRLQERYSEYNSNIHILPNLIDESIWTGKSLDRKQDEGKIIIGYSGSPAHDYDFQPVLPAIKAVLLKYPDRVSFKFLGYMPEALRGLADVSHVPLIDSYREYAGVMRHSGFDMAIAPLEDNSHNQCKSNIKFLEYSACGYPGIYSDVGPYTDSVKNKDTGILVKNTTEDWLAAMELLINDAGLRKTIGANAYRCVKEEYALQVKAEVARRVYSVIISARGKAEGGGFSLSPLFSYGPYLVYKQLRGIFGKVLRIFK